MRRSLVFFLLSALLGVSPDARAHGGDSATALRTFFDEEWAWDMAHSPEYATELGDRTHDGELTDLSPAGFAERRKHLATRLLRARGFRSATLDERDRLSLDVFIALAERDMEMTRFPYEQLALTPYEGPQMVLPTLALVPAFRTKKHYDDYLQRLRAVPRYVDQVIALLEQGRSSGWLPPRQPLRAMPATLRAMRGATPEASVLYEPMKKMPVAIDVEQQRQLRAAAADIIARQIDPAFEKLASYTERTYLPSLRDDAAAWSLPDGASYYAACVRAHTTTRKTPDEIHALGLAEVARIEAEMGKLRAKLGFADKKEVFNERLRSDPRFFYKDGALLLAGYRDIAKRIDGGLPALFRKLPRLPYGVMATPTLEAPTSTTAYYRGGTAEDGRAGMFVANTYKPETRPTWEMEALTLHEAVPGHHLQIALAQELEDLPRFRRESSFTAFVEGWGLYAESLGEQLGMFTDPYAKYGQLTYEMWRAVRLVIDTGMHHKRWTRQQAIDFFVEHTAKTRHDIEVEVDRYLVWPGQALAYKIGQLEIKRLRDLATKRLGPAFDIRQFHEVVLGAGAVPLDILERRIDTYIRAVSAPR